MKKVIITYAAGAHEELLDISLPAFAQFAGKHGYDLHVGRKMTDLPPAWNKVPLLMDALPRYDEVVWFDCDLIVTDASEDFPDMPDGASHSLVRHFEENSEVPNSGVWRVRPTAFPLLKLMMELEIFKDYGWWEQGALMTLMGYSTPPHGSKFEEFKCRCVHPTRWHRECGFMRVKWNSHPNYRADHAHIVHCSYPDMLQRIEVMRALVKDPAFDYPRYEKVGKKEGEGDE